MNRKYERARRFTSMIRDRREAATPDDKEAAARELMVRYRRVFRRRAGILPQNIRGRVGASDVLQDAFRSFISRVDDPEQEIVNAWKFIATIVDNKRIDTIRKQTREKRDPAKEVDHDPELIAPVVLGRRRVSNEDVVAIHDAVRCLSPEDQILFAQRHLLGMSIAEMAKDHGITERGMRYRLSRLEERLREAYLGKK